MKTHRTTRSDRVEQVMRWLLGVALMAAVGWAWMQSVQGSRADGHAGVGITQRS